MKMPVSAPRCAAALVLLLPAVAQAELSFIPYVGGLYTWESNVYQFSELRAQELATTFGQTEALMPEDRVTRTFGGLDTSYELSQQKARFSGELRQFSYEDHTALDRDEHRTLLGFDARVLNDHTGTIEIGEERRMASFADRWTTEPTIEVEQGGRVATSMMITPMWHLETGLRGRRLASPLSAVPFNAADPERKPRAAFPDFVLYERAWRVGGKYGIENKEAPEGEAALVSGVALEYTEVSFGGIPDTPGYALGALIGTAQYTVSGLSTLEAELGFTVFNPEPGAGADTRPDVTGSLGYKRRLSVVTEVYLKLLRGINAYTAGANSATNSGVVVGTNWTPLLNLTVAASYAYTDASYENLSSLAPENDGRRDSIHEGTLRLHYQVLRWLGLQGFGTWRDRDSSRAFDTYDEMIAGVGATLKWD